MRNKRKQKESYTAPTSLLRYFVLAAILYSLFLIPAANAASGVTISELTSTDVAILPGNPFYFFVKWRKGIQELFIDNDVEGALFQSQNLGRKAVELKKIHEFASRNKVFLIKALQDYAKAAEEFGNALEQISREELLAFKNNRISPEGVLTLLTSRISTHLRFNEELRLAFESGEHDSTLDSLEQGLTASLEYISDTFE